MCVALLRVAQEAGPLAARPWPVGGEHGGKLLVEHHVVGGDRPGGPSFLAQEYPLYMRLSLPLNTDPQLFFHLPVFFTGR